MPLIRIDQKTYEHVRRHGALSDSSNVCLRRALGLGPEPPMPEATRQRRDAAGTHDYNGDGVTVPVPAFAPWAEAVTRCYQDAAGRLHLEYDDA